MVLGASEGKHNVPLWIVAVYQLCFSEGLLSTYQQQLRHLDYQRPACPQARFMVELIEEIRNWQQSGDLLLVMGDFNDDTAQPSFKQRMQEVGLVDALASLHRQPHLPTYNRGATPIDAIYASPGLLLGASGGYLEFEDGLLSNHRGLWLDLRKEILWGGKDNLCVGGHARRLKCEDPHVVKKYNKHLLASIQKFKLLEKVDQLQQMEHIKAAELDISN